MALIAMVTYDTEQNGRTDFTKKTIESLEKTVNWDKHRLIVVDNGSCRETISFLRQLDKIAKWHLEGNAGNIGIHIPRFSAIFIDKNIGTAEAINFGWQYRKPGEHCIKIDNDVVIHQPRWADEMEEAIRRMPSIGQIGLKRKDLIESPDRSDFYKSELMMLPHAPGESWIIAEKCNHIMGTCVMHSSALLDKVGYLKQPGIYGFDDSFMSLRSQLAGFCNVFLPHIPIDHIDPGNTPYQKWKEAHAAEHWQQYQKDVLDYRTGVKSIYYNPFENGETNN